MACCLHADTPMMPPFWTDKSIYSFHVRYLVNLIAMTERKMFISPGTDIILYALVEMEGEGLDSDQFSNDKKLY